MRVVETKNDLLFVLVDVNSADTLISNAQQIDSYPIFDRASQALLEPGHQAAHYETIYHLLKSIKQVRKRHGEFALLINWLSFDSGHDETREPTDTV